MIYSSTVMNITKLNNQAYTGTCKAACYRVFLLN